MKKKSMRAGVPGRNSRRFPTAAQIRAARLVLAAVRRPRLQQTEQHLGMPWNEWRQKKRQEWKAIVNAFDTFTYGCAYTPVHDDHYKMQKLIHRMTEDMQMDWVSW